jgi:DNA modification methylase
MSTFRLICANVLDGLSQLEDESVDCVVTSPPYWGMRAYGTTPQIWDGISNCEHLFDSELPHGRRGDRGVSGTGGNLHPSLDESGCGPGAGGGGQFCSLCGAWRGEFGLEPSPQLFIEHMVQIFRDVMRVLRADGSLWLNLGDSYAGSWGNQGRKEVRGAQRPINGDMIQPVHDGRYASKQSNTGKIPEGSGLKPKDLVGIPWMAAFALRADGWYLRSEIIWHKLAPMPESVGDRPTKAHEQVFLLAKSQRYYYNTDAIREPYVGITQHDQTGQGYIAPGQTPQRGNRATSHKGSSFSQGKTGVNGLGRVSEAEREDNPAGRNKRSVWTLGPESFEGAHFAVMPEALVEPCILAGCPEGGTTLDPFCGSGTVGAVSLLHRRNFIGIDLNPDYIRMARERIYQASSPLLEDTEVA